MWEYQVFIDQGLSCSYTTTRVRAGKIKLKDMLKLKHLDQNEDNLVSTDTGPCSVWVGREYASLLPTN